MTQTADDLTEALKILRERGWTKHHYTDEYQHICAAQAIRVSCYGTEPSLYGTRMTRAERLFVQVADELFPRQTTMNSWHAVHTFNDDFRTDFPMVEQTFEKSILRAQETEVTL